MEKVARASRQGPLAKGKFCKIFYNLLLKGSCCFGVEAFYISTERRYTFVESLVSGKRRIEWVEEKLFLVFCFSP